MSTNVTAALVAAVTFVAVTFVLAVPYAQPASDGTEADTGQPPNAIGIQLLDAPVERRQDPRASRSIIDHLRKGDVIERRVQVTSTYERALDVPVYVEAASIVDGQFRPDGRGSPGNTLTDWVTVEPAPLPLGPSEANSILVTVTVPRDAPDGEFYAVVFAEAPSKGDELRTTNRAGVRLYISVGTGAEPPSGFAVDSLVAERGPAGEPQVRVNVTNIGERALDMRGELTLSEGPGGLSAGPFVAQGTTTLGLGQTGQMFVPLNESLSDGPWLATFVARSGTLERTVEAAITFPSASDTASDPADAEPVAGEAQRRALLPLAAALILAAVGALYLMLMWKA